MKIEAIDLFCGIGGLSYGLTQAKINVIAGLDNDILCKNTYEKNNKATFIHGDISTYDFRKLKKLYSTDSIKVLVGCAPCQPFSSIANRKKESYLDERWNLVKHFTKAITCIKPHIISMENVTGFTKTNIFSEFIEALKKQRYFINYKIVFCPLFGIPQKRKRLVLLASKEKNIEILKPTHSKNTYILLKDVIKKLPSIHAGEVCAHDAIHRTSQLSEINMKRIKQSLPNGTWKDWDATLLPECYKKASGKGYTNIYGRMSWNDLAPTLTTQFCNIGSGRFGHPEQDRAISLREGSLIQTFPKHYYFDTDVPPTYIAKHIGNAVPPKLGVAIGTSIKNHLEGFYGQ